MMNNIFLNTKVRLDLMGWDFDIYSHWNNLLFAYEKNFECWKEVLAEIKGLGSLKSLNNNFSKQ